MSLARSTFEGLRLSIHDLHPYKDSNNHAEIDVIDERGSAQESHLYAIEGQRAR
jgi:hypothetical protein